MEQPVRIHTGHGAQYVFNDRSYVREERNHKIYRCSKRLTHGCSACLEEREDGSWVETNAQEGAIPGHNHDDTPFIVRRHRLIQEMLHQARTTHLRLNDIFKNVSLTDAEAATFLTYNPLRVRMQNERRRAVPQIPQNLRELAHIIENMEKYRDIYVTTVYSGEQTALLFSTNELLSALEQSGDLSADGTFKVCPQLPTTSQFFTIHFRRGIYTHAAVYCLVDGQTTELYSAIFAALRHRLPNLRVHRFTCDFERAMVNAIRQNFVNVRVVGCLFHSVKAMTKKWKECGLEGFDETVLDMCLNVPLLPQNMFNAARAEITRIARQYQNENLNRFVQYMIANWFNDPRLTSLYGVSDRTNNSIESFNKKSTTRLGGRKPNVWELVDKLGVLIADEELDLRRCIRFQNPKRRPSREVKKRNEIIETNQRLLLQGRLSLPLFLQNLAVALKSVKSQMFRILPFEPRNEEEGAALMDEPERMNVMDLDSNERTAAERRRERAYVRGPYNRAVQIGNQQRNPNEQNNLQPQVPALAQQIANFVLRNMNLH